MSRKLCFIPSNATRLLRVKEISDALSCTVHHGTRFVTGSTQTAKQTFTLTSIPMANLDLSYVFELWREAMVPRMSTDKGRTCQSPHRNAPVIYWILPAVRQQC